MTNLKNVITEIKFETYAIRSTEKTYEVGDIMTEESYLWDYENDVSSFETDEPISLGGVCTTLVVKDFNNGAIYESAENMFGTPDELIKEIENIAEYNKKNYAGRNFKTYLVASDIRNPNNEYEADDCEAILANPIVLAHF